MSNRGHFSARQCYGVVRRVDLGVHSKDPSLTPPSIDL